MTTSSPLAVVTGASSGIGFELAKQFVQHGHDLVIAADTARVVDVARELRDRGRSVVAVQTDLSKPEGVEELHLAISDTGRPVDAVALNAGIGEGGAFATDTELDQELRLIDLNVRSTVHLAKLILPEMVRRGRGRLLFTSSIASTMPGAYQAVYNASKSFVQSFAQALRNELSDTGVNVTSLMPGPTDTRFFRRAHMLDTKVGRGPKDDAAEVARQGFEAMMAGDERVVAASLKTKAQALASRLLPDNVKAELHRRMAEPMSAPH